MQGWIKLHRKIRYNAIFNNHQLYRLWTICLLTATHKRREQIVGNQTVLLEPGQFVTGRFELHSEYNNGLKKKDQVSEYTVWRWLMSLEKGGFLSIKTSNKFSVVTIDNWALYQGSDNDDEQQNEQQVSNKRATNEQQMSTNKNVKNKENEKNGEKESRPDDIESIIGLNEKQDSVPDNSDTDSERKISVQEYRSKITAKYLQRRGKGLVLSNTDESEIDKYISDRIPLRTVLNGIDKAFDTFKPQHQRDEIRSLKRCSPIVFVLHAKQGTIPAAEASGAVPEADTVPPGEKGKENVIDLLEQLKKMRGDTG
ncbi:hypothetical protein [Paenibacillus dendritiformis]|uniref:hypothetical protein n=1 Tax=Paenibacillus dendritiformis TaxID=130049 RepID=UPI000DA7B278|nr:hypothetical protein [Paenibacillus dendritiformis]PZM63467.1 hypothetical protein DOE73_21750 [Paenibacillus dendritiformis]